MAKDDDYIPQEPFRPSTIAAMKAKPEISELFRRKREWLENTDPCPQCAGKGRIPKS